MNSQGREASSEKMPAGDSATRFFLTTMKSRRICTDRWANLLKLLFGLWPLLLGSSSSGADDTAYTALRLVETRYGADALDRVVQLRGDGGAWKVYLLDSASSSEATEVWVRNGRVIDVSKVANRVAPAPLNLNELNLDSDGALATVKQYTAASLAEESVTLTLSSMSDLNLPVWTATWRNKGDANVSTMYIAANTGSVLTGSTAMAAKPADIAEEAKPSRQPKPASRSKRSARESPEILDEIAQQVERRSRSVRRILPF